MIISGRQRHNEHGTGFISRLCADGAAVKYRNFMYERKPESNAAHLTASRLIHTKKRLKYAFPALLGYSAAGIRNADNRIIVLLVHRNADRAALSVILDCVFNKIEHQSIYQRVAALLSRRCRSPVPL